MYVLEFADSYLQCTESLQFWCSLQAQTRKAEVAIWPTVIIIIYDYYEVCVLCVGSFLSTSNGHHVPTKLTAGIW